MGLDEPSPFGRRKIVDTKLGVISAASSTPSDSIFLMILVVSFERAV